MSSEGETRANRRGQPRVPFDGAVRLRYRLFQEFLEENAGNISKGGMFIRTIHPGDVGSELDFEIRLDDDFPLIQGRGAVAWVRRPGDEPGADPGMGIRFLELPEESRALVEKIVGERISAGLELFDLESHAPAARPAPGPAPRTAPSGSDSSPIWQLGGAAAAAGTTPAPAPPSVPEASTPPPLDNLAELDPEVPARAATASSPPAMGSPIPAPRSVAGAAGRSSPLRLFAVALVSALLGAGAVLTFYWFYVQPSIDALETRIDELAGDPGGPWQPPADEPSPAAPPAATEPVAAPPAPASAASQEDEVLDALRGWAAAWSGQRADDYLAYYAAGFEPPDGQDRVSWEAARRARIARPEWIRVALTLVQVEPTGADTAEARFVQSYRSERYKDLVRKSMTLVREDGGWKIAAERSSG